MAIVNNGVKNDLPILQLPTGYTPPTITTFEDETYSTILSLTVDKVTVDESNPITTMTAILENVAIGLDKQVADIVALHFVASNTVESYGSFTALSHSIVNLTGKGNFLTDNLVDFVCTVKIFIKIT